MVVAPLVLSHKGSTLAQEQMPSFLGQRSVLPHFHDQRSPRDTGYPEAASHVLFAFPQARVPSWLPTSCPTPWTAIQSYTFSDSRTLKQK